LTPIPPGRIRLDAIAYAETSHCILNAIEQLQAPAKGEAVH
jgi:hypothetical protein